MRRKMSMSLCALLITTAFALFGTNTVVAESGPTGGEGNCFEVTNSTYLNVTLCSSEVVNVTLESIPRVVSFTIENVTSAQSTEITISGFELDITYYRHEDGHLMESFTADQEGNYSYTQDLSRPHHVFIQEESSTLFIRDDATGGECIPPIGNWNPPTCTLTSDVIGMIVIESDGITLNGNGRTVDGRHRTYGIYVSGYSRITIENIRILFFLYPIFLFNSHENTVMENDLLSNDDSTDHAIHLSQSNDNIIDQNTISLYSEGTITTGHGCRYGIFGPSSSLNTISGNSVSCSFMGIWVGGRNIITGNTIDDTMIGISAHRGGISGNTVTNSRRGISLHGADDATYVSGNLVRENDFGIWVKDSPGIIVTGNYVWFNNDVGIYVKNSPGADTTGNDLSGNPIGIHIVIDPSTGLRISGNTIMYGIYGIYLEYSDDNTLSGNTIMYTTYGLYLDHSNNNMIFRNNLIGNTNQVYEVESTNTWDNGAGEGTYWTDYTGLDDGSGGRVAGDGVGDTDLPHQGVDWFPLMSPWYPAPVDAIEVMKKYIGGLDLPHGVKNSLISQLNAVEEALSNGNENAAVNILNAFIHHVEALRKTGKLTQEQAEYLTLSAQNVIESIEGG